MPITFSIDAAKGTVRSTITGPVLDDDLVQYLSDVLAHPSYRPGLSTLVVCEDVELGRFSPRAIRRMAEFSRSVEREVKGTRIAIVAKQRVAFGFARMYQLLRDPPYELRVFRETSEAEAWLASGAPSPPAG